MSYDLIIGRDLLRELGIVLDFKNNTIQWDDVEMPMKSNQQVQNEHFHIQEDKFYPSESDRIKKILEAKYQPADLKEVIREASYLSREEQQQLYELLKRFETLFDGTVGKWEGVRADITLKPGVKPYHAKPYPVPKAHERTLKLEVERLCKARILKKVNHSEWASPHFIIGKKDLTIRMITDLRELNKRIQRNPYPIPKIQDLLLKLEGFMYATSLDLNMGYYHIELTPTAKKYCTIVFPFGKYEYQRLPMGLCNSPDIFQEKMSELMTGLEFVRVYLDDILCITCGTFKEHLHQLEQVFKRLKDAKLKVNLRKSSLAKPELEYLGYWITREGIKPVTKKIEALMKIQTPRTKRELRRFIGMINFYRDMWIRRSHILAPLAKLTSKSVKWKWTDVEQKAFDTIKKVISEEVQKCYYNIQISIRNLSYTQMQVRHNWEL